MHFSFSLFRLNEKCIQVRPLPSGEIDITIRGPWLHTILFEIPVLAIVNEVYFRNTQPVPDFIEGRRRLDEKIRSLQTDELRELLGRPPGNVPWGGVSSGVSVPT